MTTPDQIVDERQRLVARLRVRAVTYEKLGDEYDSNGMEPTLNARFLRDAADQIEQDGKRVAELGDHLLVLIDHSESAQNDVHRARTALASPSGGNKKGYGLGQADFVHALNADGLAAGASSRPQEQPRKATDAEVAAFINRFNATPPSLVTGATFTWANVEASLNAVFALSVSPAAAEGWQSVPIKLTDPMIRAAYLGDALSYGRDGAEATKNLWLRMLAAAPPSPAAQEQEKGEQT